MADLLSTNQKAGFDIWIHFLKYNQKPKEVALYGNRNVLLKVILTHCIWSLRSQKKEKKA